MRRFQTWKTGPALGLFADPVRAVAARELRDAQSRIAIRLVEQLLDFLLRRHLIQQVVNARLPTGSGGLGLRLRGTADESPKNQCKERAEKRPGGAGGPVRLD